MMFDNYNNNFSAWKLLFFVVVFLAGIIYVSSLALSQEENDRTDYNFTDKGFEAFQDGKSYTPYSETIDLGSGKKSAEIYSAQKFLVEDDVVKTVQEARSLVGTDYHPVRLVDDGIGDIVYEDWNWTSVSFKVKLKDNELAKSLKDLDIPVKKDGVIEKTKKLKEVEELSDSVILTFDEGLIGHNWSFGSSSTVDIITFSDSNGSFNDTYITNTGANERGYNFGGSTYGFASGNGDGGTGYFRIGFVWVNLSDFVPQGATFSNVTFQVNSHEYIEEDRHSFILMNQYWHEGSLNSATGNSSCVANNNSMGDVPWIVNCASGKPYVDPAWLYNSGDAVLNLTHYPFQPPSEDYIGIEFDAALVTEYFGIFGDLNFQINSSETTETSLWNVHGKQTATPEKFYLEYTAAGSNTAPSWSAIEDIVVEEDFVNFTIDLDDNISDAEDADASLSVSYLINNSDFVMSLDNATHVITIGYFTANTSGSANISLVVSDTEGLEAFESFDLVVSAVNDAPTVSSIFYNSTTGATSNFLFNQYLDTVQFDCQDFAEGDAFVSASVDLFNPSGSTILSNVSASSGADNLSVYDTDTQLSGAGVWTINASCVDVNGATGSDTALFTVISQNVSTKDGWYGFKLDNATASNLTDNYLYGVDLFELNYSISTQLRDEWNTSNILRIDEAYNLSVRVGLNIVFDYDYSEANVQLAKERINDTLCDINNDPYSSTVEYIGIEVLDGLADADKAAVMNNLSSEIAMITDNKFIVYSTNFNSSLLDTAYLEYTPMVYLELESASKWIHDEAITLITNSSLNRVYVNVSDGSIKDRVKDYQENVLDIIRGTPVTTAVDISNLTAELSNGDVVVFNDGASFAKIGIDVSSITDSVGEDVWDATNKELYEVNTDGIFDVNVSGYNASVIYFEDISSIRYDTGTSKAYVYSGGSSTKSTFDYTPSSGTIYDNFALSGAVDIKAELFDGHYRKNNFLTYYGQLNSAYINFTSPEMSDYEVVIVANQSYDWEVLNYSATDWYGYISVADYSDTDGWETAKKAEVDDWLDNNNESFDIFIDGLDTGIGGANFNTRFKNVVDYAQVVRNVSVILNTYTAYEQFATWGAGGVMKESCVNRWNGASASNPDNYSREDWSLELNKSVWYQSHNIRVLCQAFDSRDVGANLYYVANATELMNIFFASKVLGYDYFYLSQPDFNYVSTLYVYDVGLDLQNGFSSDDDETYYRRYSNGIVYYNSTSGVGWFEDGRHVESAEICFDLYKPSTNPGSKTFEFTINKDAAANVNGDYAITLDSLPADTWTTVCTDLNETDINNASGRYIVEAWVMPRSTTPGQGCNLANVLDDGAGKHSWWDTSATDSFTAYGFGQNWKINITVNETKTTSFDSLASISQSVANDSNIYNLTLSSGKSYPIEVWSGAVGFPAEFRNLTYLHSDNNYYGLQPFETSSCDTNNPSFNTVSIDGSDFKSCYENSSTGIIVRVAAPSLSDRLFQLNGDNTPPVFQPIDDIVVLEDFGSFSIDLSDNLSDVEDALASLVVDFENNDTSVVTISSLDNATKILTFASVANVSGSANISLTVWDTAGSSDLESFVLIVDGVNDVPFPPLLFMPDNLSSLLPPFVLNWTNSTDIEGDLLSYKLQVSDDLGFSSVDYENSSIAETDNITGDSFTVSGSGFYYWRVSAYDGAGYSPWSEVRYFNLSDSGAPTVVIVSPTSKDYVEKFSLEVSAVDDVSVDTVWYEIVKNGISIIPNTSISSNITVEPPIGTQYVVHAYANDSLNQVGTSSVSGIDIKLEDSGSIGSTGDSGDGGVEEEAEELPDEPVIYFDEDDKELPAFINPVKIYDDLVNHFEDSFTTGYDLDDKPKFSEFFNKYRYLVISLILFLTYFLAYYKKLGKFRIGIFALILALGVYLAVDNWALLFAYIGVSISPSIQYPLVYGLLVASFVFFSAFYLYKRFFLRRLKNGNHP